MRLRSGWHARLSIILLWYANDVDMRSLFYAYGNQATRMRLTELHGADARLAWVNVQIRLQPQRIKTKRAKSCDVAESKVLLRELLRAAAQQERIHHLLTEDHD
jgi:hypothetical protein